MIISSFSEIETQISILKNFLSQVVIERHTKENANKSEYSSDFIDFAVIVKDQSLADEYKKRIIDEWNSKLCYL